MRVLSSVERKYVSGGDIEIGPGGSITMTGGGHTTIYPPSSTEYQGGVAETGWSNDGASYIRYTDGSETVTYADGYQNHWDPEAGSSGSWS